MKDVLREDVGGPATALALNKATNQVAVAGRSVLKIYNICEKGFELSANLRAVKSAVASCNDIAWNQVNDNILATATPSGSVITWNLSKPTLSKMDIVYQDHKRTVNKVHFHGTDPYLLLSGSQDSIKVFDLRQNEAVINYSSLNESVRDLQFSPHKFNTFIAVQDNGYAQLYDLRKKDKFELCFPGHNGPILACDWHPDHADCVATAGRDMSIKVWNVATQTPSMQHCIPTMESVSKIRWSTENKNHIASCSLKRDYNINIWNILRPYIAYAKFTQPHEITTGMAWRSQQASLISITNIGILYQLSMSDAYRPLDHANPVGMAINPDGDIALALGNSLIRTNNQTAGGGQNFNGQTSKLASGLQSGNTSSISQKQASLPNKLPYQVAGSLRGGRQSLTRRSQDSALNPRVSSRSQLDVYKCTEMNWFVKTAKEYQLSKRPLAELCDHNAEVCAKLRRFQICQTWKILKLFYANIASANQQVPNQQQVNNSTAALALAAGQLAQMTGANNGGAATSSSNHANRQASTSNQLIGGSDNLSIGSHHLHASSEFSYITKNPTSRNSLTQANTIATNLDSALMDEENCSLVGSEGTNESTGDEWLSHETLSYEAFQPKHDFCGQINKLINKKLGDSHSTSGSSNHDDDELTASANPAANMGGGGGGGGSSLKVSSNTPEVGEHDLKITHLANPKAYQYKFYEIIADVIADVLKYHVDNSDVQSAVSILIVLGDRIKNIVNERIPEVDRESWYHSYIDLLSKFQLWNVMSQVINLSPLQNINSINQTSTTIYTTCGTCNRPLNGKVGWICERCKTKPSECSVCHGVVSGLMAWCQSCYHGGHLIHMNRWFMENEFCPTGCGHQCELGHWR
uniref:GATOR2 complex protein WDR24 n=1 Tax=Aceria tosichella TaxID=561515 RepID=A0A6G1SKG5_9ACAR